MCSEAERPFDRVESLEQLVLDAGRYVRPDETLRCRTIEAARLHESDQCVRRSFAMTMLAVGLVLASITSGFELIRRDVNSMPTYQEAYKQHKASGDPAVVSPWMFVDAVMRWRSDQAEAIMDLRDQAKR